MKPPSQQRQLDGTREVMAGYLSCGCHAVATVKVRLTIAADRALDDGYCIRNTPVPCPTCRRRVFATIVDPHAPARPATTTP